MEGVPDIEERARRAELAEGLERRSQDIVERWLAKLRVEVFAADAPPTALVDGVAEYLTTLAALLRGHKTLDGAGTTAWNDVAREHAITRVKLGFDVMQLAHELVILRRVITETLREEGLVRDVDQVSRLTDLIEAAMMASIKSYVDFRDYAARRSESEHIGFLTHELRNPLGAIALAASQLRRDAPPNQLRLMDLLDRNIERMQRMIADVLLTERLQTGEVECRPIDISLGDLVRDVLEVRQHAAREKGISLKATYDPAMQLRVDPKLTLSAFENLLDNAVKFTDAGEVTLDVEDQGTEIVVHVRDHCRGLSPEELRVIFEPFRRAHHGNPGTGLGLAIVRRAIEVQGGRVHAESNQGEGCHFWFTLPRTHH